MHATVLVIGDDVDSLMEPYGCESEDYMEMVEENISGYEDTYKTQTLKAVLFPDGRSLFPSDAAKVEPKIKRAEGSPYGEYELPKGFTMIDIPLTELYDTCKEWMIAQEIVPYDKTEDKFGYMSNPNSVWDWYEEGGRWKDCIPSKTGKKGYTTCKIKDADFNKPTPKWVKHYGAVWEYAVNGILTPGFEKSSMEYHLMGKDDKAHKKIISDMKKMGKRAFIDVNATFTPTTILSNDGWEEMNTREDFLTRLSEFDPDDTITLVDYHM